MPVWKYPLHIGTIEYLLPEGTEILAVKKLNLNQQPHIVVELDPARPWVRCVFFIGLAGETLPKECKPEQYVCLGTTKFPWDERTYYVFQIVDPPADINLTLQGDSL